MENVEDNFEGDKISVDASPSAVNNLILDYYKKFGRKRDLEQFFSLSTAQSDIRDTTGTFWRRMKSQDDSSDSGEKKSESSAELCRISIKCSIPERSSLQRQQFEEQQKSDSVSPRIVTDDVAQTSRDSDEDSGKSDDNQSQRSNDATMDASMNKPHSPTSSVTSQRKLEWDSLADVGYANETDRKTSASSLSTLERLALKQQYSHNDSRQNEDIGHPTSHSTPNEETEVKSKGKKGLIKKTTKIYQKDVDLVELNVPHCSQTNLPQAISVNLNKHISFNVEKDGEINIDNIKRNFSVSPEKLVESKRQIQEKQDKEIQTSLSRDKDKINNLADTPNNESKNPQRYPVLISLNTLRNRNRKKKLKMAQKAMRNKKKLKVEKENVTQEKATEQVSEAESFEYMPGHIYNQNQLKIHPSRGTHVGNKSSLESSAALTTDSSNRSKCSFSKDLENSIELLRTALQQNNEDATLKRKLIKEVVQRLIKSKYRDDSSTDVLSGVSLNSKTIGREENHTTSSTSDGNNTGVTNKGERMMRTGPKKSILRNEKFNANAIASTSQSAPNLPSVFNSDKPVTSNLTKPVFYSNTDSDMSFNGKNSSKIGVAKTSSEELYKKYLEALKREEEYKKHLKNKDNFIKQKLVSSETALTKLAQFDLKAQSKLKNLLKDLSRNNYDDGSGDAGKLQSYTNSDMNPCAFLSKPRSHSVFTLSSGNSDDQGKKSCYRSKIQNVIHDSSKSKGRQDEYHYCCCPFHKDHVKVGVTDSSVQVNINSPKEKPVTQDDSSKNTKYMTGMKECPRNITKVVSDSETGDLKYICMCSAEDKPLPENILIYKCSKLINKSVQLGESLNRSSNRDTESCTKDMHVCRCTNQKDQPKIIQEEFNNNALEVNNCGNSSIFRVTKNSKALETNENLNPILQRKSSMRSVSSQSSESTNFMQNLNKKKPKEIGKIGISGNDTSKLFIHEAVRTIQTEISINPRLSDPCLSDIKIIDDKDCVKVISEQYKEVVKPNIENITEDHSSGKNFIASNVSSSVKINSKTSSEKFELDDIGTDDFSIAKVDKEMQSDLDAIANIKDINTMGNFTIPIHGTNMTLKVNLGTSNDGNVKSQNDKKSQGVVTERINVAEEFTSLRDDCTKSVQCTDAHIFQQIYQGNFEPSNAKVYKGKTCQLNIPKYNTYPKEDQINPRKPLLRTNTDLSKFEVLKKFDSESNDKPVNQTTCVNNNQKVVADNIEKSNEQESPEISNASSEKSFKTDNDFKLKSKKKNTSESESQPEYSNKDPLLDIIQDITKRYSKKDIDKGKRKKCFKEIMNVLNYLLDTEDSTDEHNKKKSSKDSTSSDQKKDNLDSEKDIPETASNLPKAFVDKGVQLSTKKSRSNKTRNNDVSENTASTDFPTTSTDSATCKVLNKIKKECERYHQQRCKTHNGLKACETSSTTSVNCNQCRKVHHCYCARHKFRNKTKTTDKAKKKCVAYNLIIQTSDSIVSEEAVAGHNRVPLKSIIVKVPSKRKQAENMPFKEMSAKIERNMPNYCPASNRSHRSRSLPNESEISSTEEFLRKAQTYTVREYLERNRPDFVANTSKRQDCLKVINETRPQTQTSPYVKMLVVHTPKCVTNTCLDPRTIYCGGMPTCKHCNDPYNMHVRKEVTRIGEIFGMSKHERNSKRKLLSLQLDRQEALSELTDEELRHFAKQLSEQLRRKKVAPKFISEREMKKHSEKIYKSLPEVTRKKEELKKENIKKTNLLMANIFKRNLQKKTLGGSVNLSNYSTVIKI